MTEAAKYPTGSKSATNDTKMKKDSSSSPSRIDENLVEKALSALIKYHKDQAKKKDEERSTRALLGTDRPIQVQIGLEVAPVEPSRKPIRIIIPHPLHQVEAIGNEENEGLEEPDVCLIVKDGSKPWVQEMIQEFPDHLGCIKKVLGLDSLRKKHNTFAQRRELLHKFDVFMADDRILPMLSSALGKDFIKAKKLPIPITLTRKEALPFAVQRNLSSTYMVVSKGTSIMIRAGNTGMPMKTLVENVVAIANHAGEKIPRKWANIRNIAVKTPESTSLPFYHRLPEELLVIAKLAGIEPAFKDIADSKMKSSDDEENEDNSPKRKIDLATKSPLIRALKKQKKTDNEKQPVEVETKTTGKTTKNKSPKEFKESITDKKDETKKIENDTVKSDKKKKKESQIEAPPAATEQQAKKEKFIASHKFKGSKKGYVFRMGDKGVGYYVDVRPVVDKMVLEALLRSARPAQGKRSKSGGKRRDRR